MASKRHKRHGLLGIEFHETEIRAVELRFTGGKPIVLGAGVTPMPPNAMVEGEIVRADAVAFALRKLLDNMGAGSTEAIIGIPITGFTTRTLNMPPVPAEEQAMLIEGEVRHFDILRTPDGAYDYFPLAATDTSETSVVLFAAEGPITTSLRVAVERAGLEVLALEPVSLGMLRAAATNGVSSPEGLFLTIGETASEASIIRDGRVWLYRRIDIGTNALFASGSEMDHRIDHRMSKEEQEEAATRKVREIRKGPADSLSVEVRRTMEFYAREFAGANPVNVVHLMLNDTVLEVLEPFLRDGVGASVEIVRPGGFVSQSDESGQELASELGYRYCGAFGLALHRSEYGEIVPTLDLFVRERSMAAMELKRKTLAGSLAASIAGIAMGMAGSYYFGLQARRVEDDVEQIRRNIAALRSMQQATLKSNQETIEQISYLSTQGVPVVSMIDRLSGAMDPEVGFNKVVFENERSATLSGEAKSIQSLVSTVQRVQGMPDLGFAVVNSYERMHKDTQDPAISFSLRLIRPAPAPPPPAPPMGGAAR